MPVPSPRPATIQPRFRSACMKRVSLRLPPRSGNDVAMTLPLALIHGWGQLGCIWRELLARLAPRFPDLPLCNLGLPGHGQAAVADFELDALVDAYAAAAPARCMVLGWSLGGML